jgi:hypothetical protein
MEKSPVTLQMAASIPSSRLRSAVFNHQKMWGTLRLALGPFSCRNQPDVSGPLCCTYIVVCSVHVVETFSRTLFDVTFLLALFALLYVCFFVLYSGSCNVLSSHTLPASPHNDSPYRAVPDSNTARSSGRMSPFARMEKPTRQSKTRHSVSREETHSAFWISKPPARLCVPPDTSISRYSNKRQTKRTPTTTHPERKE